MPIVCHKGPSLLCSECIGVIGSELQCNMLPCRRDWHRFPIYAVQVAVLCGSANIFVAAEGCGCLAEGRGGFTF